LKKFHANIGDISLTPERVFCGFTGIFINLIKELQNMYHNLAKSKGMQLLMCVSVAK